MTQRHPTRPGDAPMKLAEAIAAIEVLGGTEAREAGEVRLSMEGAVAELRISNPTARNAMTVAMMGDLGRAVERLQSWSGAALVLHAAPGSAFCAGGHLRDVNRAVDRPERAQQMAEAMGTILDALLELPCVSVAALDGLALGGGAELATACDHRVLGPGGAVHFVHARLWIVPGWGGTGRLVAQVGRTKALQLLTDARVVRGEEACALGLATAWSDQEPAADLARRILAPLLVLPAAAVRAAKKQIVAAAPARAGSLHDEAAAFASVWGGGDHLAALAKLARHIR